MTYQTAAKRVAKARESLEALTPTERAAFRMESPAAGELRRELVELRKLTTDFMPDGEE